MSRRVVFLVAAAVFLVMPSGTAHGDSSLFLPYVVYPTGRGALAMGDVNGDGRTDLITSYVQVFLQDPTGYLESPVEYLAGNRGSVDVGDLNGDGKDDLATTAEDGVGVLLQNDHGALDPMVTYASNHSSSSNAYKVRVGDFNSDGLLDVVSIDWGTQSHDVDVFLQNLSGTLDAPRTYQVAHGGYDDLEVGDINNDGREDIIVMSGQGGYDNIGALLQTADGTFAPPAYYDLNTGHLARGAGVGDTNGDALEDVVLSYPGHIGTLVQNVDGTLDPVIGYPSYPHPEPVEVADVDLDERDDIVTVHAGWLKLGVYRQRDDGSLNPEELYDIPYASHYNLHGLAVGDINGDGGADVAVFDYNHGLVVLYHSPPDCLFQDDRGNGTRLSVWGENWTLAGPGGFEASGTSARRHGDRVVIGGRSGNVVVSGEGMCPSGAGHFRAVELDPPRRKLRLVDLG